MDAKKQSELISAKADEVFEALKNDTSAYDSTHDQGPYFSQRAIKDAIHGATASGYLLALQTLHATVQTDAANVVVNDIHHENVRGM